MGYSTPSSVYVKGMDLSNDILGKMNLGDMAWLEMTGTMPTPQQSTVFNAILVTLVEHGVTPQAIAARMVFLCSPESFQAAIAAGLCGIGSRFGGGSEDAARMLTEALEQSPTATIDELARELVKTRRAEKRTIPGLGHPLHKPIDPRTPKLFEIALANGFHGRYVELMEAISRHASTNGRPLPVNAPGAIGALSCELGLPWRAARGIAVIGRAVGLVGHLIEEMKNPLAMELWLRTESEAGNNEIEKHNPSSGG